MCHKPSRTEGQAKLQRWAEERRGKEPHGSGTSSNVSPRGNGDRDDRDLERGLERFEAMLGR